MVSTQVAAPQAAIELTPLNGIRFFAVFHIFLYHLWGTRNEFRADAGPMHEVYSALDSLPPLVNNFIAHGYLSTSFFFLLSGFILAYLYWTPAGTLATSNRRFWWTRFTRIYPIHVLVLLLTVLLSLPRYWFDPGAPGVLISIASFFATATLTQAWVPPLVPVWSWPTWALSAVVFLYLIMPWLMRVLARMSRRAQITLLAALPVISLVPTLVFLAFFPDGAEKNVTLQIFIGSTPLFWVAQFAAGMLLARICGISRFATAWREKSGGWFGAGDLALAGIIALSLMEPHSTAWRHVLRHGLLMPLYLLIIRDFALRRGVAARIFSLPGMSFIGQASFSVFIWQNFLMAVSIYVGFMTGRPELALPVAIVSVLVMSLVSTYGIEKP